MTYTAHRHFEPTAIAFHCLTWRVIVEKIIVAMIAAILSTGAVKEAEATGKSVLFKNCKEAFAAGFHDMQRGQPGYAPKLDRDKDGVACETDNRWVEYRKDGKYHKVDDED